MRPRKEEGKLYLAPNDACGMTTLNERDKRQVQSFEQWLKEQGILEEEDG